MVLPRYSLGLIPLLLAGCAAAPVLPPSEISLPATYGEQAPGLAAVDPGQWWRAFADPVLDGLVVRAQAGNLDLRQAAARVAQARAQEQATRASGGPRVNVAGQGGYTRLSDNALPSALSNLGGGSGAGGQSALGIPGEGFTTFQAGFDASWELDLFGRQASANEAADARGDASVWSARDAQVILTAEVVRTYQRYRMLQRRIAIADETLVGERDLLGLVRARGSNGLATTLDERLQEREMDRIAAQRADLVAQQRAQVQALALLLGTVDGGVAAELAEPPASAPVVFDVPVGLPSDLLRRRADVRAADRRLAAATAEIGIARADLYPRFSLTGALQLASRALSSIVSADSIFANGTGRVSLPLIDGGAGRATVRLREAQRDEALFAYQAQVLSAFRDVKDALARSDADRQRMGHLQASERAAHDVLDTHMVRHRNGLVAYADVLIARRQWLGARDALVQAQADAALDQVALFKALGGGWDDRRMDEKGGVADGRDN